MSERHHCDIVTPHVEMNWPSNPQQTMPVTMSWLVAMYTVIS